MAVIKKVPDAATLYVVQKMKGRGLLGLRMQQQQLCGYVNPKLQIYPSFPYPSVIMFVFSDCGSASVLYVNSFVSFFFF